MSTLISARLRYGALAQVFHWSTVVLVAIAYLTSPGGQETRVYAAASDFTRELHETTGLVLFALVLARILWRAIDPAPQTPPMEPWMRFAAKATHLALYTLLIAIPATAILGAWWEGHSLTLLGASFAPQLVEAHGLGQSVAYLHTILGNVIIWLAGAHAAAALFHHFVLRDGVLASMLPDWHKPRRRLSAALWRPASGIFADKRSRTL